MKWLAIILLMLTSCTVNHYTCECKHQAQFMPGYKTVPGYKTFPSNTNLFKGERIGIGSYDTISMNGKLGMGITNPSHEIHIDYYGPPTPTKLIDIKGTRLIIDTLNVIK